MVSSAGMGDNLQNISSQTYKSIAKNQTYKTLSPVLNIVTNFLTYISNEDNFTGATLCSN